jgi:hypothetical protein
MKLSDTQLMILSSASQRTDHAAVLPANLKGSAANKVVNKLLNEKLLQELRAKDDMPDTYLNRLFDVLNVPEAGTTNLRNCGR